MNDQKSCPQCRAALPADAPEGLCPQCLIKGGLPASSGITALPDEDSTVIASGPVEAPAQPFESQIENRKSEIVNRRVRYLGDYELLEEIARGGMGIVYKARQVSLNRIVAVKMMLTGQLASEAEVKRFRTEAEAAAQLQHPNIVAIHEVGEYEGQHYFSMDYVNGKNLAELTRDGALPATRAARYVRIMAEAVQYAHQRGVLHRDLKPSNVLIDEADQPRITDFGLARRMEQDSGLTQTGAVLGTPAYMSPEQAEGRRVDVGPASDVYSLGAILYSLLIGQPPYDGSTPMEILLKVREQHPKKPRTLNRLVPEDLETICLKCLEKSPTRRYPTARDLAEELERFLKGEPVEAQPVSVARRAWHWAVGRPWALTGIVSLLMVVFVLLAYGLWAQNRFLRWKLANPVRPLSEYVPWTSKLTGTAGEDRQSWVLVLLVGAQWFFARLTLYRRIKGSLRRIFPWTIGTLGVMAIAYGLLGFLASIEKTLQLGSRVLDTPWSVFVIWIGTEMVRRAYQQHHFEMTGSATDAFWKELRAAVDKIRPTERPVGFATGAIWLFGAFAFLFFMGSPAVGEHPLPPRSVVGYLTAGVISWLMGFVIGCFKDRLPSEQEILRLLMVLLILCLAMTGYFLPNAGTVWGSITGFTAGILIPIVALKERPRILSKMWRKEAGRLRRASDQGDPLAQYHLALAYREGRGVPKDEAEAARWTRRAADQGFTLAQLLLGTMYETGTGVDQDYREARRWYRKPAEQGLAEAQVRLGTLYYNGQGGPQDYLEAAAWFQKAAEQKDANAQFMLALIYYFGHGAPKNYSESLRWLRKAVDQGHAAAERNLAAMYRLGHGVPQSDTEAVKWVRRAAKRGDAEAEFYLGSAYEEGRGVPKNERKAFKWFQKAAEHGFPQAQSKLGQISP